MLCTCNHQAGSTKHFFAVEAHACSVQTDVMEEGTKAFVKEVKALPKAVRDEDCFKVCSSSCTSSATLCHLSSRSCIGYISTIICVNCRDQ